MNIRKFFLKRKASKLLSKLSTIAGKKKNSSDIEMLQYKIENKYSVADLKEIAQHIQKRIDFLISRRAWESKWKLSRKRRKALKRK